MKKRLVVYFFICVLTITSALSQRNETQSELRGIVLFNETSVDQATVENLNTNEAVLTKRDGTFSISGKKGDKLKIKHIRFQDISVTIVDVTELIKIEFTEDSNILDETIIEVDRTDSSNLETGEKSVSTSRASVNRETTGYRVQHLDTETIAPTHASLSEALVGKLPGLRIERGQVYLRGKKTINLDYPAVWEVDGVLVLNEPSINLADISDVYTLSSTAATVRYGEAGNGGVIVIKTKFESGFKLDKKSSTNSLLNKNTYKDDALSGEDLYSSKVKPTFTKSDNLEKLKALAFEYQKEMKLDSALAVLKKIFEKKPAEAQSHRDLAQAFLNAGKYDEAWELYSNYAAQSKVSKYEGIGEIIFNEMEWLYYNRQAASKIKGQFIPSHKTKKDFERDIRIVFEWNSLEAEFDLEFVNPDKLSYTFMHTLLGDPELLKNEKDRGYSSREFSIPEIAYKDWLINMTYYGNKTKDPTYFKVTTFYNWGRPNQTQKVKVFELKKIDLKYQLLKYNNNSVNINY